MLAGGVNDIDGTLMEKTISRMVGSEHGSAKSPQELAELAMGAGRPVRQRTMTYGSVPEERAAATARGGAQRRSLVVLPR
ncbi:hypothetical protein E9529_10260 [Blastococcus sp. KM273128]|uniref:hypothetical protein n=1 Tax=Blastococcus sp. KM273128 TaxID=2570314 RepID=UPI001F344A04|nr:hypothetical protein [Blastococcus sp. KM273128]MCF6744658.1 hypothetical protein [Blastococcus sp. KM273128]